MSVFSPHIAVSKTDGYRGPPTHASPIGNIPQVAVSDAARRWAFTILTFPSAMSPKNQVLAGHCSPIPAPDLPPHGAPSIPPALCDRPV